jgi:hypothetical protein
MNERVHDSPVESDHSGSAGAPDNGIEVTPEMIEAGFEESCLYDFDDPKEWEVAAVYRAMETVRRRSREEVHRSDKQNLPVEDKLPPQTDGTPARDK